MSVYEEINEAINRLVKTLEFSRITKEIKQYERSFGWTSGGCFGFAEAIVKVLRGSEVWVVAQQDLSSGDYPANHAVVKYINKFFDATGLVSKSKLLSKYSLRTDALDATPILFPADDPRVWYPEQEFVTDAEKKKIGHLFTRIRNA